MNYFLFWDTETTGLVNKTQVASHPSQPHLVQLGVLLTTDTGSEVAAASLIVKPDGWTIPEGAAKVHGITTEIALAVGVPLAVAVAVFTNLRSRASGIVAHNIDFDEKVMGAAIHRTGRQPSSPGPDARFCTMEMATPIVNLPPTTRMVATGFNKPKPAQLGECVRFFFNEDLAGAHDAMVDVRACARVFFEIRRRQATESEAAWPQNTEQG